VKSAAIAISFPVYASAGMSEIALNRRTFEDFSLKGPNPTCEVRLH
jgi:hypothetical protein